MGTVKYSGPIASFHCPTEATIRSLKVHFSPKQLGEGTPSPENVREIAGWDGVTAEKSGKNLWGGSAMKEAIANNFPIVSTDNNIITYSNSGAAQADGAILFSSFKPNTQYTLVLTYSKSTNVYTHIAFLYSDGSYTMHNRVAQDNPNTKTTEVYVSKANKTLTAIVRRADEYSNVTLYCDESGLFEGVITKSEFESYHGETIDYEFGVLGKNKYDYSSTDIKQGAARNDSGEEIVIADNNYDSYYTPVLPNTTYTISGLGTSRGYKRIYYYTQEKEWIERSNYWTNSVTSFSFTTPINCYYIQLQSGQSETYKTVQIELGSTATAYEPYDPNKTIYGGYVDLVSGELIEEGINNYPYEFISLNGTENWELVNQNEQTTIFKYYYGIGAKSEGKSICSHFKLTLPSYTQLNIPNAFVHGMSGNLFIQTDNSLASTVEEFTNYLQEQYQNNTPVNVLFQANRTNKTYSFPPYSKELKTFLSQNNIWSNADYVEVEYDLHETQDILARKQFIIANQPHIVKASGDLVNFNTDMVAPLKECKVYFEPIQEGEGDPSPDNIRPISGWNELKLWASGKNILPDWKSIYVNRRQDGETFNGLTYSFTENGFQVTGTATASGRANLGGSGKESYFIANNSPILKGGHTYIISYNKTGSLLNNGSGQVQNRSGWIQPGTAFQLVNDGYAWLYHALTTEEGLTYNEKVENVQLELGSVATNYEPYKGITIPIDWSTISEIPGGYVDLINGELVQEWKSIILNGEETWSSQAPRTFSNIDYDTLFLSNSLSDMVYGQSTHGIISNMPTSTTASQKSNTGILCGQFGWADKRFYIFNATQYLDGVSNVATLKTYLSQNPIQICYKLATPIHYIIDPIILKTLRGINNIWSNANGPIEIKYWTH